MEMKFHDICIVGGGASGMAAAIEAKLDRPELRVLIVERNAELGRKLRATGNGRCNLTNTAADGYVRSLAFFRRVGIATRAYPNGLVYPHSESARDVAELLAAKLDRLGVEILTEASVTSISRSVNGFVVDVRHTADDGIAEDIAIPAGSVLIAAGGKAGPNYGTTGDGCRLAASLGHSIVPAIPVLTAVECAGCGCDRLSGIRVRGRVILYRNDEKIFEEDGEIQFTRTGLSGICVFNMTRMMRFDRKLGIGIFSIGVDLYPNEDLRTFLFDRRQEAADISSSEETATILRTVFRGPLAEYVLEKSNADMTGRISDISDADIEKIAVEASDLRFDPSSIKGWKDAQCTSGGVSLDEIDEDTCESKIVPGLYISGETADYDGPCGGFNLNNAWLTGIAAGRSMAEKE